MALANRDARELIYDWNAVFMEYRGRSLEIRDRNKLHPVPRKNKIILVQHIFGQGGTDRVSAHLARGFADGGLQPEILAFCGGGKAQKFLAGLLGEKVSVTFLGHRRITRKADLFARLPAFIRHLKQERPDFLLSTGNNVSRITALGLCLSGIKDCQLVVKTTNPIIRPGESRLSRTWRSWRYSHVFSKADAVITLSDPETSKLKTAYPKLADRFMTGINPYITSEMLHLPTQRCSNTGKKIIAIGRFTAQKRLDLLIRAFARMKTADTQLILLGDGPDRESLHQLVSSLGLQDRVTMPGFVPNVEGWLHQADLFVLPSKYEGLPAVVLEAMAANCPILSTDCFPSARDLIEPAEGCAIIERPDASLLADMIDASLSLPRPTHLHAVARHYSIENGVESHLAILAKISSAKTR